MTRAAGAQPLVGARRGRGRCGCWWAAGCWWGNPGRARDRNVGSSFQHDHSRGARTSTNMNVPGRLARDRGRLAGSSSVALLLSSSSRSCARAALRSAIPSLGLFDVANDLRVGAPHGPPCLCFCASCEWPSGKFDPTFLSGFSLCPLGRHAPFGFDLAASTLRCRPAAWQNLSKSIMDKKRVSRRIFPAFDMIFRGREKRFLQNPSSGA